MPFLAHLGTGIFIDDITDTVSESSISISDSMESGADSMSFYKPFMESYDDTAAQTGLPGPDQWFRAHEGWLEDTPR